MRKYNKAADVQKQGMKYDTAAEQREMCEKSSRPCGRQKIRRTTNALACTDSKKSNMERKNLYRNPMLAEMSTKANESSWLAQVDHSINQLNRVRRQKKSLKPFIH